jgi:type IV pilus assembly protein PilE
MGRNRLSSCRPNCAVAIPAWCRNAGIFGRVAGFARAGSAARPGRSTPLRCTYDGRHLRGRTRTRLAGFTLIEVMIVVAIVAILASIAYPSYVDYVVKSRRATAAACLHDHAQFMERFNALNLSYAIPALPVLTCVGDLNSGQTHYRFTRDIPDTPLAAATTYTVNAVPQGHQAAKDTKCGTLSLNQAGVRTHSGSGSDRDCWR